MRKTTFVLSVLLAIAFLFSNAQSGSVRIVSDLTFLSDTSHLQLGDTMKYEYQIVNDGDGFVEITYPFWNGSGYTWFPKFDHKISVENNDFPSTPLIYSFVDDHHGTVSVTLYDSDNSMMISMVDPNDTAYVYVEDVLIPSRHSQGNNTIVVWPDNLAGVTIPDSLEYQVTIKAEDALLPSTNISHSKGINNIEIFPNPGNNFVYILGLNELGNEVSGVSIHNLNGQLVKEFNGIYEQYDVSDLPAGHYTVNFNLNGKGSFAKPLIIRK